MITAIGLLSESLATVEQELSPDDPIFTYKVKIEEPLWMGGRNGKPKISPEEFLRGNPDASEKDIEKAEHKRLLNSFNGLSWDKAVLSGIENGVLTYDDNAKHLCRFVSGAWQKKRWPYGAFLKRVKTQMNMIGAKPHTNPVISHEHIAYYFKTGNAKFLVGKNPDITSIPHAYIKTFYGDIDEIKDESVRKYQINIRSQLKKSVAHTGVGKSESFYDRGLIISKVYGEDDTIVIYIPVTKKGFIEFYENPEAQKPPQFLYEFLNKFTEDSKAQDFQVYSKLLDSRGAHSEKELAYISAKRNQYVKNQNEYFKYKLDFINSERTVRFEHGFSRSSGITSKTYQPYWFITFHILSEYPKDGDIKDIKFGVKCVKGSRGGHSFSMDKLEKPYFMEVPYDKIRHCKPYKNWLNCHVKNMKTATQCRDVPIEEPEICTP